MLVLCAHGLLLGGMPSGAAGAVASTAPPEALQAAKAPVMLKTRQIVSAPLSAPPTPTWAAPNPVRPAVAPVALPSVTRIAAARPRPHATRSAAPAEGPSDPPAPQTGTTTLVADSPPSLILAAAPAAAQESAASASEGADVPVYATRLPPAARLQYELRRGPLRGDGRMIWAPGAQAYELSLEGTALGAKLIAWDSRGGFDAAGIAPVRYTDRRRGKDAQAANFRRDSARITFSGPAVELPLAPGTQDRLSWMVQLPAIIGADPARFGPGERVSMWVVGARGDLSVWAFSVLAREAVDLPAGTVAAALRLQREPRKPYDTQVDVWLDPARHHLPVKVRLSIPQTGDSTEFLLQAIEQP